MRILLSEGSSLTSRQVATRLGQLGHKVELLSSTPICLSRFTRHVGAVHAVPRFGQDPFGWFDAARRVARERKIDLLFPTHEQVTVLSAMAGHIGVPTIVPPFEALLRVQDKISAYEALVEAEVPQPETVIVSNDSALSRVVRFPSFIKIPVSTASAGVRRVVSQEELVRTARAFDLGRTDLVVQTAVSGPLAMVQAVADRGRLVALHANIRLREGVGGGASLKESIFVPGLLQIVARLVSHLCWHGGLSMDVILSPGGPVVIDVNPRLVEPGNALASGVDLVGAMLALDHATPDDSALTGRAGVRTRQTLLAVLGAARDDGPRRAIIREAWNAIRAKGPYLGSTEELTPVRGDPAAALPLMVALAATLIHPAIWKKFHAGAVGPYALTPDAWQQIIDVFSSNEGTGQAQ